MKDEIKGIDILSNLVITKIYSVSTMYNPRHAGAKRIDRPCWALIFKYEGETVYTANGKHYVSDALHPTLLPKGASYHWECTKSGHYSIIEFDCEQTHTEPISFTLKSGEKLLNAFKDLEYKRTLNKPSQWIASVRDAYSILLLLASTAESEYIPGEKQEKLAPAIEYISKNYNRPLTNELLAAQAGLSTVYFRKLFTKIFGTSPIAYAHALRIQKAKEMLGSDYGSLSDVAQSLGYASLYDFSRDFKKHVGIPPSKYKITKTV